jgi:hypothetical protein
VNALVDVDTDREVAVSLTTIGTGAPPPPTAPAVRRAGLATIPPSPREVDYPAIRAAHSASSLASGSDAAAFRSAGAGVEPPPPFPYANLVAKPVESVILRRGSARRFARTSIAWMELDAVLGAAVRSVPADVAIAGDPYLIVNAVEGLESGAYVYRRGERALARLRGGDFRRDAGYLALGQDLAADAAVGVFWLVDLRPVLARHGDRGYRAAQLLAAIEGGKAYLAAYALGLGATGLTVFDDDVTAFFSPDAAGKSVMFLVAIGRPAPRATAR